MHLIDLGFSFACGLSYWWVVIGFISDISGQICPLLKGRHQLYVMIHFHAAVLFIAFKQLIVMVSEGRALPRGSCVVVLWVFMTASWPSSYFPPPQDASIRVWSADKSRLSFYLDQSEKQALQACAFFNLNTVHFPMYMSDVCVSVWYK